MVQCTLDRAAREIFIQGEGALPLVQLSISFLIGCFEKHNFYFLLFKQPSLKLIDNCTRGSEPCPFIKISLDYPNTKLVWFSSPPSNLVHLVYLYKYQLVRFSSPHSNLVHLVYLYNYQLAVVLDVVDGLGGEYDVIEVVVGFTDQSLL